MAPSPAEVAARADVLTIHLPLAPETRQLVNGDVLAACGRALRDQHRTRRGRDYDALRAVTREKHLRVALDVFPSEPAASTGDFADPIVQEAGIYGTHHIGASTAQAQEAIAAETVRIVETYLKTGRRPMPSISNENEWG